MSLSAAQWLAGRVAEILGANARSVILHGSLAAGGFVPGRSDIDLLAVIDGDVPEERLVRLVRRADLGEAVGLDLHVVTAEVAASPGREPPLELYVGRHDGSSVGFEIERSVPAAPDLLAELSMARAHGRALWGASPREVIGPVPADWIVDRGRHWLRTWLSLTDDAENATFMALTACRIWRFAVENVHCSKAEAAAWAFEQDRSLTFDDVGALLTRVLHETQ